MARVVTIPAAGDLLCEGCGYVLNGLPPDARCPECGKPARESSPELRRLPRWETPPGASFGAFLATSTALWFAPAHFFRGLTPGPVHPRSLRFARIHAGLASILLGLAASVHFEWFLSMGGQRLGTLRFVLLLMLACAATYVTLNLVTRLASQLTNWEGAYRGLRLPLPAVQRALQYLRLITSPSR